MTQLRNSIKKGTVIQDLEGSTEDECSAKDPDLIFVCDEYYRGPYFGFWHDQGWVMDMENCSMATKRTKIKNLITVVTVYEQQKFQHEHVIQYSKRFSRDLDNNYPGVVGLVATKSRLSLSNAVAFNNVKIIEFSPTSTESEMWYSLISSAKTPYVLVGRSLHTFYGKWANLERSIRLLGSKLMFFLFYF